MRVLGTRAERRVGSNPTIRTIKNKLGKPRYIERGEVKRAETDSRCVSRVDAD